MPDLVKAENVGDEIHLAGDVDHRANGEEQPASEQPQQSPERHGGDHILHGKDRHPSHHQIDAGGDPARRINDEQLDDDAGQGKRPDDVQKAPAPKSGEEIETKRSVATGDQNIDG